MTWTTTNGVAVGNPTKKSDYDKLWNNATYLGGMSTPQIQQFRNLSLFTVPIGVGAGCAVTGTVNGSGGIASISSVPSGGSGYAVGDYLLVPGGNTNAVLEVAGVSSGVVTAVNIVNAGSGYSPPLTAVVTTEICNSLKFSFSEGILQNGGAVMGQMPGGTYYVNGNTMPLAPLSPQWVTAPSSSPIEVNTQTGAPNGLDAGNPQALTWYHVWAIYAPPTVTQTTGTVAGLLSLSSTTPALPAGYTFSAYMGAVYRNASNGFDPMVQTGKTAFSGSTQLPLAISTGGGGTSPGLATLSVNLPPTAVQVIDGTLTQTQNGAGTGYMYIGRNAGIADVSFIHYFQFAGTATTPARIPLINGNQFYTWFSNVYLTGGFTPATNGWQFP